MKKVWLFCIAILYLQFTSCSTAINNNRINDSFSVLGYWVLTEVNYTGISEVTQEGEAALEFNLAGSSIASDANVAFMQNPNQFVSNGSVSLEITTTGNGHNITDIFDNNIFFPTLGTWERIDNQIFVSEDGTTKAYTIVSLTPNRIELEHEGTEILNDQSSNTSIRNNFTVTIVLAK